MLHATSAPLSILALTLVALPATAQAAPASPAATMTAARKSALFKRELSRAQLRKAGLATLAASPGVTMDFERYVAATALPTSPGLKPLVKGKATRAHLVRRPVYTETILELRDRLIVDRQLVVELLPGTCAKTALPKAIRNLCFSKNRKNRKPRGLTRELAQMRRRFAGQPASKRVSGSVTVGQARAMNDEQLLAVVLGDDTRRIRHVSIVPRKSNKPGTLNPGTRGFGSRPLPATPAAGLDRATPKPTRPGQHSWNGPPQTFATDYFLTGFTLGDEIDDTWEYTIAESAWWHDRYYVRVDYHLGFGFGVRAPFSVDVSHQGAGAGRAVSLSVDPVNVDASGSPAYPAVGLDKGKYFGGNEFVLELKASCHLKVAIPGPDINKACPKVDKSASRDIAPVLGDDKSKIASWWLRGAQTGLGIDVGVASASLDVGLAASITNGRIGLNVQPLAHSKISGLPAQVWLGSAEPVAFNVSRTANAAGAGFSLSEPRYGFDAQLQPQLRAQVGVDVWIYENEWTLGPWALDFLSISRSFQLTRHAGTVATHTYELFRGAPGGTSKPGHSGTPAPRPPAPSGRKRAR